MGGKPQKPKIQAYVEQRWFDEFEVYRSTHSLNQSRALEKILSEFFGGSSTPTLPSDEEADVTTSVLVESLRAELTELRQELDHRLRLVESRLASESASESATLIDATTSTDESATELATPQAESAGCVDGLATESATAPDGLASESAIVGDARAVNPLEDMALGDIGEVENASVGNMLEDIPALATPSSELVEEGSAKLDQEHKLKALTSPKLQERLGVSNGTISKHKDKGNEHFSKWSAELDPDGVPWEYREGPSPRFHPLVESSITP